jgi:peptidoglycan/LPS O-acetylase OafA/YrhL
MSTTEAHRRGLTGRPSATGDRRIISLDGVRALSLLILMGYHFGVGWLQGGFFGLDIFYVLSGYLITGLLLSEYRKRGSIRLPAFWLRRARRLLPALLIVLAAVTLYVRFVAVPGLYPDFRMSALSALFYFSNWWQIASSSNYFVNTGATSPLTHTWSLAVEEQFYLVWPLVVLAVLTLARTFATAVRALLVVSVVGAVGSAIEMVLLYTPRANITRLYFGTDTHAQSILIGSVLACIMTMVETNRGNQGMAPSASSPRARFLLTTLGLVGVAGTLTLTLTLVGTSPFDYRGGFTLSALSAAAIVTGAVCVPNGILSRVLSLRLLVWLGTISYGAYLWHFPVAIALDAARTGQTGLSLLAIRFATTLLLATASFYFVERPVMEGTFWRSLKAVGPAVALMGITVVVIVVGTVGESTALPSVGASVPSVRPTGASVPVLVFGDSTALTLTYSLASYATASHDGLDLIDGGMEACGIAEGSSFVDNGVLTRDLPECNPSDPASGQWPNILHYELLEDHAKVLVLLAGRWEVYDRTDSQGRITNITHPAYANYVRQQIQRVVTIAVDAGCRVVLLTAPYYDSGEQPDGQPEPQDQPVRVRDYNRLLTEVARANRRVAVLVNLNAMVSPDGHYTATIGSLTVRTPDGVHFPFDNLAQPDAPAPDTEQQVDAFGRWIGPKIDPVIAHQAGLTSSPCRAC